jgi:hypothetical protein
MHTLPYISLPAPLINKEEKHSFYTKKKCEPRRETSPQKLKACKRKLKDQLVIITSKKAGDAKE